MKITPLFLRTISYIDILIDELDACCHVLIVSRGWATNVPAAPAQKKK